MLKLIISRSILALMLVGSSILKSGEPDIKWIENRIKKLAEASEKNLAEGVSGEEGFWFMDRIISNKEFALHMDDVYLWVHQASHAELQHQVARQFLLSSSVFRIENPNRAHDQIALDIAGLAGVARSYEKIIEKDPTFRTKNMDGLIAVYKANRLNDLVKKILKI